MTGPIGSTQGGTSYHSINENCQKLQEQGKTLMKDLEWAHQLRNDSRNGGYGTKFLCGVGRAFVQMKITYDRYQASKTAKELCKNYHQFVGDGQAGTVQQPAEETVNRVDAVRDRLVLLFDSETYKETNSSEERSRIDSRVFGTAAELVNTIHEEIEVPRRLEGYIANQRQNAASLAERGAALLADRNENNGDGAAKALLREEVLGCADESYFAEWKDLQTEGEYFSSYRDLDVARRNRQMMANLSHAKSTYEALLSKQRQPQKNTVVLPRSGSDNRLKPLTMRAAVTLFERNSEEISSSLVELGVISHHSDDTQLVMKDPTVWKVLAETFGKELDQLDYLVALADYHADQFPAEPGDPDGPENLDNREEMETRSGERFEWEARLPKGELELARAVNKVDYEMGSHHYFAADETLGLTQVTSESALVQMERRLKELEKPSPPSPSDIIREVLVHRKMSESLERINKGELSSVLEGLNFLRARHEDAPLNDSKLLAQLLELQMGDDQVGEWREQIRGEIDQDLTRAFRPDLFLEGLLQPGEARERLVARELDAHRAEYEEEMRANSEIVLMPLIDKIKFGRLPEEFLASDDSAITVAWNELHGEISELPEIEPGEDRRKKIRMMARTIREMPQWRILKGEIYKALNREEPQVPSDSDLREQVEPQIDRAIRSQMSKREAVFYADVHRLVGQTTPSAVARSLGTFNRNELGAAILDAQKKVVSTAEVGEALAKLGEIREAASAPLRRSAEALKNEGAAYHNALIAEDPPTSMSEIELLAKNYSIALQNYRDVHTEYQNDQVGEKVACRAFEMAEVRLQEMKLGPEAHVTILEVLQSKKERIASYVANQAPSLFKDQQLARLFGEDGVPEAVQQRQEGVSQLREMLQLDCRVMTDVLLARRQVEDALAVRAEKAAAVPGEVANIEHNTLPKLSADRAKYERVRDALNSVEEFVVNPAAGTLAPEMLNLLGEFEELVDAPNIVRYHSYLTELNRKMEKYGSVDRLAAQKGIDEAVLQTRVLLSSLVEHDCLPQAAKDTPGIFYVNADGTKTAVPFSEISAEHLTGEWLAATREEYQKSRVKLRGSPENRIAAWDRIEGQLVSQLKRVRKRQRALAFNAEQTQAETEQTTGALIRALANAKKVVEERLDGYDQSIREETMRLDRLLGGYGSGDDFSSSEEQLEMGRERLEKLKGFAEQGFGYSVPSRRRPRRGRGSSSGESSVGD